MSIKLEELPDDIKSLKKIIANLSEKYDDLENSHKIVQSELTQKERDYIILKEQHELLKNKLYGKSSEKNKGETSDQPGLFNEAELGIYETESDKSSQITVKEHKRKKSGRKPLPDNLPVKEIIHDLPEEEKKCSCCGKEYPLIGSDETKEVEIIPARIYIVKHKRLKYGSCGCNESRFKEEPEVKTAKMPERILPGSIASPGLLAFIFTAKFADSMPFYRVEKMFARYGIDISRMNMCNWAIKISEKCSELIDVMWEEIRGAPFMQMDETSLQVIAEPGRSADSKSYMWVNIGYKDDKPLIIFHYHPTRSGEVVSNALQGFKGYLQTDGYNGYNRIDGLEDIIHVGCFVHSRRKFDEALKASNNKGSSMVAISHIKEIYQIEKILRDRLNKNEICNNEFASERKKQVVPVLEKFKKWLDKKITEVPPETLIGKAVNYTLGEWDKMTRYVEAWFITPDNNRAENAIRPFVIGRKNWLFAYTPRGAHASSCIYSLVETAKANGLEPYHYLKYLFTKLPHVKNRIELKSLLPTMIKSEDLMQI